VAQHDQHMARGGVVVHREGLRLTGLRGNRAEHNAHRAARVGRHARKGRQRPAYMRAGRSVGVGRNVPSR
jgi:hypothetical protein